MQVQNGLPEKWIWLPLEECCDVISGYAFKSKDFVQSLEIPVVKIGNIGYSEFLWQDQEYLSQRFSEDFSQYLVKPNAILMALTRPITNDTLKVCMYPKDAKVGLLNQRVAMLNPASYLYGEFLFLYMQSSQFKTQVSKGMSQTLQPNLSPFALKKFMLPLCSNAEQQRIVNKVEALFSFLDAGAESLRKVKAQLKRYRQAVLKYAFEGKLTEEWRKTHKDQIEPTKKLLERINVVAQRNSLKKNYQMLVSNNLVQEVPQTWSWARLGELVSESLLGLVIPISLQNKKPGGTSYVKMNNISSDGILDLTSIVYVQVNHADIQKYQLKKGDILFNTRNSYELVGKTCVVKTDEMPMVFNNNIMRIRLAEGINPFFVTYQMNSPTFRDLMIREKKATTNICALYAKDLFPLPIVVAPVEEQRRIVEEIDRCISVVNEVGKVITLGFQQIDRLRQSILRAAFEGILVLQDPDDEPAAKLLERIKAERFKSKTEIDNQLELPRYAK